VADPRRVAVPECAVLRLALRSESPVAQWCRPLHRCWQGCPRWGSCRVRSARRTIGEARAAAPRRANRLPDAGPRPEASTSNRWHASCSRTSPGHRTERPEPADGRRAPTRSHHREHGIRAFSNAPESSRAACRGTIGRASRPSHASSDTPRRWRREAKTPRACGAWLDLAEAWRITEALRDLQGQPLGRRAAARHRPPHAVPPDGQARHRAELADLTPGPRAGRPAHAAARAAQKEHRARRLRATRPCLCLWTGLDPCPAQPGLDGCAAVERGAPVSPGSGGDPTRTRTSAARAR